MLSVELLGGFLLRSGDMVQALPRKAAAVIAVLALAGDRAVPRERLAAMLWEDSAETAARASLRQAIAAIRRVSSGDALIIEAHGGLCLDTDRVAIDVRAFERLVAGSEAERAQAIALFRGDLLADFPSAGSQWSAWVEGERSRLRGLAASAMEAHAANALANRRADEALAVAARLVALEPWHEPGHRLMMEALATIGRAGDALRHYRRLQEQLRDELQIPPEPETVALAGRLGSRRRNAPVPEPDPQPTGDMPELFDTATRLPQRELRRLAVVSAGLAGQTEVMMSAGLEAMPALLAAWHKAAESAVTSVGGVVHAWLGDQLVAIFGLNAARIDDPRRAVECALALQDRASELPAPAGVRLGARAGVAVGGALVDLGDGSGLIVGQVLADAQALQARAARGETLVEACIEPELGGRFRLSPAGEGVVGVGMGAGRVAEAQPLVGRRGDLGQLEALATAVTEENGLVVVLRGEAGIGKTRLVTALHERLAATGWAVHRAEIGDVGDAAIGTGASTPRRMISRSMLGLSGDSGGTLDVTPVAQAIDRTLRPWLRQIAGLLAPPEAATSPDRETDLPESGRAEAFAALLAASSAVRPQLLVIEDAHWASPAVLEQLAGIARAVRASRAMMVLTCRPDEERFSGDWRERAGATITIDLRRMAAEDLASIATGLGITDPDLAAGCAARADGNPLYLRQLVAAVLLGEDLGRALPGSVQSLVLGRLDRLDASERQLLRAASVLGRTVPLDLFAAVTGVADYWPSDKAAPALVAVTDDRLIFAHALVRDAVRASLLPSDARALHLAAAEWHARRDPLPAARHWAAAGDARAPAAFADAARHAINEHRADRAFDHVEEGLAVATEPRDRVQLELLAGTALTRLRRPAEGVAAARRASAIGTAADLLAARLIEVDALAAVPDSEAVLAAVAETLAGLKDDEALAERARLHAIRGNVHFLAGRIDSCLADQQTSLDLARRAGGAMAEAGARVSLAWAHYQRGGFTAAVREATAGLLLAEAGGFSRIQLAALRVRSVSRIFLLDHDSALGDCETAISLADAQGDWINEILARTTAGTIHLERLEAVDALARVQPALDLAGRLGDTGLEVAPLWVVGTAHGVLGEREQGLRCLERARAAISGHSPMRFALPRILGTLVWFVDLPARDALIAEGEASLQQAPVAHSALGFWGSVLQAALWQGDRLLVDRCIVGINGSSTEELSAWGAATVDLGKTWRPMLDPNPVPEVKAAAEAYRTRCRATAALAWHRPTIHAVMNRANSNNENRK